MTIGVTGGRLTPGSMVDQGGRYSKLPVSRLELLTTLAHSDFAIRIRELHELVMKRGKKQGPECR